MTDLTGQTIGQYQIVERLGRGGMADVYKAFHPGLAVHRALKVIRAEFVTEADFKERFQREAQAVAALRHPNIVQMHDFGAQNSLYYMVMEFLDGQDLKNYLIHRGQIRPFRHVLVITRQIASGLSYAHEQGVVHRDIKPGNIMLIPRGQVIITDFGVAKMVSMEERLSQTGVGIGTPAYMAPEQAQGLPDVGPSADIYSLGIVLYEMLTGQVPFSADTPLAVMLKVVNDPIPPPRDLSPDIPDVLQGVILKATAKDPAQRYPTVDALVDGLEQSLSANAVRTDASPPVKPEQGQGKSLWWVVGTILVVLLCLLFSGVGAGLYFWMRPTLFPQPTIQIAAPSPTSMPTQVIAATLTPTQTSTPEPTPTPTRVVALEPTAISEQASTPTPPTPAPVEVPTIDGIEIQLDTPISGEIQTPGEITNYTFEGTAGQSIFIDYITWEGEGTDFRLVSPDGITELFNYDDYIENFIDYGPLTLEQTGTYVYTIDPKGDSTVEYEFVVREIAPLSIEGGVIEFENLVSGTIEIPGQTVTYRFEGTAGQSIFIDYITWEGDSTDFRLVAPDGITELFNYDDYIENFIDYGPLTLEQTGTYVYTIDPKGDNTVEYEFVIELTN